MCIILIITVYYYILQVPWPINLMFPNYLLLLYNNVFSFLLQVKYARWALDQIWCKISETLLIKRDLFYYNIQNMLIEYLL